ncbi:GNAT family N-acetyltransferase [Oceanithermus sp.]|uniref:GNAT family N-acetyltransferase n=1 Tax=Oceanithermus sp. TaxID=2268145 RepID=UPI0025E6D0E9|nr:GNAT family N-acetyltransferase [Oceanithermus sp.]
MRVRAGEPRDAADLRRLLEGLVGRRLEPELVGELNAQLLRFLGGEGTTLVVLEDDGRVVGAVTLWVRRGLYDDGPVAVVDRLVLDPAYRTPEHALRLLEEAYGVARTVGALDLEVLDAEGSYLPDEALQALGLEPARLWRSRML